MRLFTRPGVRLFTGRAIVLCATALALGCVSCTDTGPSGLNRNALIGELSDDEMRQLCSWVIGEQGGEGAVFECGAFQVTNDTVEQCVRERGELDPCFLSVAHVEDCIVAAGPNPCAIVSTPECDPYLSCITR